MARPEHVFVFCYDVEKDGVRARLADLLATRLSRVQQSVFEGRLTAAAARELGRRAERMLGVDDSLRVYCISGAALALCAAHGGAPLPERQDFFLL